MTQDEYARKMQELDTLLNDPDVRMDPARVWSLLADLSGRETGSQAQRGPGRSTALAATCPSGSAD
jgi:hypothetical protein